MNKVQLLILLCILGASCFMIGSEWEIIRHKTGVIEWMTLHHGNHESQSIQCGVNK